MMAFGEMRCILSTSRAVLNSASLENISNKYVRYMSGKRDKLYGVEEGHAEQKNEVRKEKYWRKRNPSRKGMYWREVNGYDKNNALHSGAFALIPDWTDENGEVGAPTPLQEKVAEQNLRLINQVYEAALIAKKAQEFETPPRQNSNIVHSDPQPKN